MKEIKSVEDFKNIVESGKPVLLDFYADWCGPCQVLLPTIEKLAEKHGDHFEIAKVNVDKNGELAQQFAIRSIPALFFMQDQKILEKVQGYQSRVTV